MPTCPLCHSENNTHYTRAYDIEYHVTDEGFDFRLCEPCGILFIDPMPVDRLSEIYPANYYSYGLKNSSFAERVKGLLDKRHFQRLLRTLNGNELSVLDVGGGTGWQMDLMRSADRRITRTSIVDLDRRAEEAAQQAGHMFHYGRFEEAALEDEAFDFILMLNLIEHVADPRSVLVKARKALKRSGRILIKTPNFDALDAKLFRDRSWAGYHTPRHFILFRKDSFENLCASCGFAVINFRYTQGAPFWSVSVLEELRKRGLVSISAQRPAIYHPLMPFLQIGAAGFDFLRQPFAKLSQMEFVLAPLNSFMSDISAMT